MKNAFVYALALCGFWWGCSEEKTEPLPDLPPIEVPASVAGLYSGRMPCDECKAHLVRMRLENDSVANVVETLVTDSVHADTLHGKYSVSNGLVSVVFDSPKKRWDFKRENIGNLVLLTGAGTEYEDGDGLKVKLMRIYEKKNVQEEK